MGHDEALKIIIEWVKNFDDENFIDQVSLQIMAYLVVELKPKIADELLLKMAKPGFTKSTASYDSGDAFMLASSLLFDFSKEIKNLSSESTSLSH